MEHRYRAHGMTILSSLELPLLTVPPGLLGRDLVLRRGADRYVTSDDPPGSVLATLDRPDGSALYRLARTDGSTILRYPGLCDFVGDARMSDVTAHLHPGADPGLVAVLASGALIATHLKLHDELVLHASAVELGGSALAFVGSSGMGKSTIAAALCRGEGRLVSDDVLRVDLTDPTSARVHPGSTENRLRPGARELADEAPAGATRPTADGRLALRARSCATAPLPLAACVVPLPSRLAVDVSVRPLRGARALMRLVRFPRVVGWIEPTSSATEFQALAELVERVPVFEASIPWGPPFRPEVLDGLLDAVVFAGQR